MENLIRIGEAARLLGIKRVTLERWLRRGQGPAALQVVDGGQRFFSRADLMEWKLAHMQPGNLGPSADAA